MAANIKKIPVSQLKLGMFVHAFDSTWLANPFWRSRVLLDDPAKLKLAQSSGIAQCWIDLDRGDDIAPEAAPRPAAPASGRRDFQSELAAAAILCDQARTATMEMFQQARLGNAVDTSRCATLVEEIAGSVSSSPAALISLVRLKSRDDYTYMHSVAVCALMVGLGQALGMDREQCREAGVAGLLHDIGKCGVPLDILNKPGKLSDGEFSTMRQHPLRGHAMLLKAGGVSAGVLDVCLHHHEKVDGSGYPYRQQGDAISLLARMGAVCDVYDAITSERPYKAGWDPAEAVAQMLTWQGHFDQDVLAAFIRTLGIYPTGALVRLKSGRLAVVLEQNPSALTKPVVIVFHSVRLNLALVPERLELASSRTGDAIEGREPREAWPALDIDAVWAGRRAPGRPAA